MSFMPELINAKTPGRILSLQRMHMAAHFATGASASSITHWIWQFINLTSPAPLRRRRLGKSPQCKLPSLIQLKKGLVKWKYTGGSQSYCRRDNPAVRSPVTIFLLVSRTDHIANFLVGYASRDESTPSQSLPENPRLSESPSKSADIDSAINMSPPAPNSNTMVPNGASAAPATPEADRPGPDLEMSDTINPLILGRRLSELLGDEDIGAQATQSVWADRTPIEDGLMGPHHTDYNPLEDGFMTANHTDYNPLEDGFMAPHHTDYNPFEDGHVWPDYIIPPD